MTLNWAGDHHRTPEEERRNREAALDETIEASFPASDPPSSDPNPDDDEAATKTDQRITRSKTNRKAEWVNGKASPYQMR